MEVKNPSFTIVNYVPHHQGVVIRRLVPDQVAAITVASDPSFNLRNRPVFMEVAIIASTDRLIRHS